MRVLRKANWLWWGGPFHVNSRFLSPDPCQLSNQLEELLWWCYVLQKWISSEPRGAATRVARLGSDVDYRSWVVSNSIRGWGIHFWSPQSHQSNPSSCYGSRHGSGRRERELTWRVRPILSQHAFRRTRITFSKMRIVLIPYICFLIISREEHSESMRNISK